MRKSIIYYTDSELDPTIAEPVRQQLQVAAGDIEIISISLKPLDFGHNLVFDGKRGILSMFRQIVLGIESSDADILYLVEHDVLYTKHQFDFIPPDPDKAYYNLALWNIRASDGHCLFYEAKKVSQLSGYRTTLLEHYRKRLAKIEQVGFTMKMGFEPGSHRRKERVDDLQSEGWYAPVPAVDIRHSQNLTPSRWNIEQWRDKRSAKGWTEGDSIPVWGKIAPFPEFLASLPRDL